MCISTPFINAFVIKESNGTSADQSEPSIPAVKKEPEITADIFRGQLIPFRAWMNHLALKRTQITCLPKHILWADNSNYLNEIGIVSPSDTEWKRAACIIYYINSFVFPFLFI